MQSANFVRRAGTVLPMIVLLAAFARPGSAGASPVTAAPSHAPAKPAPPCELPASLPATIASRWTIYGGAKTLGCYERTTGSTSYFRMGQIMSIASPAYGSTATMSAFVDAAHSIHLYWDTQYFQDEAYTTWIVRLSSNGSLVNQVTYKPGDRPYGGEVGGKFGTAVIVHPGGRHGALQVALEGCFKEGMPGSLCAGFQTLQFSL